MKHAKLTISVLLIFSMCLGIVGCTENNTEDSVDKQKISNISVDKFNEELIDFMGIASDDISEIDYQDERELSCTPSESCEMVITEYNQEVYEMYGASDITRTNMYELSIDFIRANYNLINSGSIPNSDGEVDVETITHRFEEDYGYVVLITSDEAYINYTAPNHEGMDRMLYAGYYADFVIIEIRAFDGDIDKVLEFIEHLGLPSI